jgi:molybdate transport system permease protein
MSALQLSLLVTACATALIILLGVPLAWTLARQRFPGQVLVETLILLPLVLPPSVVGYYLLLGLGSGGPLDVVGVRLLFTWQAAVVAATIVGLPLMVKSARAAIGSVDPALENAARVCGSPEWEIFFRITLPLARRGIVAGVMLGAARAFGEFGATLMVAGSIPGRTQTLPLAIYDAVQAGRYGDAHMLVLLTSVLAFLSLLAVGWLERSDPQRAPAPARAIDG